MEDLWGDVGAEIGVENGSREEVGISGLKFDTGNWLSDVRNSLLFGWTEDILTDTGAFTLNILSC